MKLLRDVPIKRKLTLIFLITTSTALILASAALFSYEYRSYRNALKDELLTLAQITGDNSSVALTFDNPEDAAEILGTLRAQPQIVSACIYNLHGVPLTNYFRLGSEHILPARPSAATDFVLEKDHLGYFAPILNKKTKEQIGTIYLRADLHVLRERVKLYAVIVSLVFYFRPDSGAGPDRKKNHGTKRLFDAGGKNERGRTGQFHGHFQPDVGANPNAGCVVTPIQRRTRTTCPGTHQRTSTASAAERIDFEFRR
jgi:hypothetical protein